MQSQFENFIAQVDLSQQDLIPMIDLEEMNHWKGEEYHAKLNEFLRLVEVALRQKATDLYLQHLLQPEPQRPLPPISFSDRPPWQRDSPWMWDGSNWTAWQFSDDGEIDGIPERVDPIY